MFSWQTWLRAMLLTPLQLYWWLLVLILTIWLSKVRFFWSDFGNLFGFQAFLAVQHSACVSLSPGLLFDAYGQRSLQPQSALSSPSLLQQSIQMKTNGDAYMLRLCTVFSLLLLSWLDQSLPGMMSTYKYT